MSDLNLPPTSDATPSTSRPSAVSGGSHGSVIAGSLLILIGAIFLVFNVLHIDFGKVWPIIFFIIAAGFYLPVLLMPAERKNLSGLLIPGTILTGLGVIFFYNTLSGDWGSWAYIWALIPASVGLGLFFAARVGKWGDDTMKGGFWMFVISAAICLIMAAFFNGGNVGALGAILLIGLGVYLLLQSVRR